MSHYRDDLEAARARIETLDAKLRERDASLEARDAELAEVRAQMARERNGAAGAADPTLAGRNGQRALLVALAACGFATATGYAMVRPPYCHSPYRARPPLAVQVDRSAAAAFPPAGRQVLLPLDHGARRPFDRAAASRALAGAARLAAECGAIEGPDVAEGVAGGVAVTFDPSGVVLAADLTRGRFTGTAIGACVADTFRFRTEAVPPFDGAPMTVSGSFTLE